MEDIKEIGCKDCMDLPKEQRSGMPAIERSLDGEGFLWYCDKCWAKRSLLPCPSCDSQNVELIGGLDKQTGTTRFDRVQCKFCGVTGPWFDGHPLDAMAGWNAMPRREYKPTPETEDGSGGQEPYNHG